MMPPPPRGCRSLHLNEDNGRFSLLALLIVLYLLCGAAVFSAVERPSELRAHGRWSRTLRNFSDAFNISVRDLGAPAAGVRGRHRPPAFRAGRAAAPLGFYGGLLLRGDRGVDYRFWDDHSGDDSRQGVPDLLRTPGLRRHHPLLQPLPGAHHHPAGRGHEGGEGAPHPEQRHPAAGHPPRLLRLLVPGLEALGVPRHADPRPVGHHHLLLRLGHVHAGGRLGIPGLPLLLLCHLQHHRLRGLCQQPGSGLRVPERVPAGKLPVHADGRVLHLLALQRHLHRHQAGAQLDAGEDGLPVLPALRQGQRPAGPPQRHPPGLEEPQGPDGQGARLGGAVRQRHGGPPAVGGDDLHEGPHGVQQGVAGDYAETALRVGQRLPQDSVRERSPQRLFRRGGGARHYEQQAGRDQQLQV
ncbi:unnamed protein product, partial [Merluccius merluccius]